jgi:elongation factor Ts
LSAQINSETDFVARNDQFLRLVSDAASAALALGKARGPAAAADLDVAALSAAHLPGGAALGDAVADVAAAVRENIRLRRAFFLAPFTPSTSTAIIGAYIHGRVAPGLGRIASLVLLENTASNGFQSPADLAKNLAMHVAAASPRHVDRSQVPAADVEAERALLREQAAASGKPAAVVEKMVDGRMGKFYERVCLLEQRYILDDTMKVGIFFPHPFSFFLWCILL